MSFPGEYVPSSDSDGSDASFSPGQLEHLEAIAQMPSDSEDGDYMPGGIADDDDDMFIDVDEDDEEEDEEAGAGGLDGERNEEDEARDHDEEPSLRIGFDRELMDALFCRAVLG